jgi:hypothetical protein
VAAPTKRSSRSAAASRPGCVRTAWLNTGSGTQYPLRYEIVELVEPELLVLKCEPMPEIGLHHSTATRIEHQEEAGKTRITLTDGPYTEEGAGRRRRLGERLNKLLEALLVSSTYERRYGHTAPRRGLRAPGSTPRSQSLQPQPLRPVQSQHRLLGPHRAFAIRA